MAKALWIKYAGKSPSMETIYRDDYVPVVKEFMEKGKPITESLIEAIPFIGCQLPFGVTVPLGWASEARDEISRDDREINYDVT